MTIPSLIFAFLISSLYGVIYHLIRGGGPGRLFLYLIFGWAGFAVGHLVGQWQGWILLPAGQLNLGLSTISSFGMLVLGDWLTSIRTSPQQTFSDEDNEV